MGMKISLLLVTGLLLGAAPTAPTEPTPKAEKVIFSPEAATITISPGTKPINLRPVKAEHGSKIRLELPGVTIEAVCLRIKSEGSIVEMQVTKDGSIHARKVQGGQKGETGGTPKPASSGTACPRSLENPGEKPVKLYHYGPAPIEEPGK